MKKLIAITTALLIGAGMLLAPPASAGARENKLFYKIVTTSAPELKLVKRKQLFRIAKTTCRYLRAGFMPTDAVIMGIENGLTRNAAISIVTGAIVFYCPEQEEYI